jgi:hypothetical protein
MLSDAVPGLLPAYLGEFLFLVVWHFLVSCLKDRIPEQRRDGDSRRLFVLEEYGGREMCISRDRGSKAAQQGLA